MELADPTPRHSRVAASCSRRSFTAIRVWRRWPRPPADSFYLPLPRPGYTKGWRILPRLPIATARVDGSPQSISWDSTARFCRKPKRCSGRAGQQSAADEVADQHQHRGPLSQQGDVVWWMLRDMGQANQPLRRPWPAYRADADTTTRHTAAFDEAQPKRDLESFFDEWVYRDRALADFTIAASIPAKPWVRILCGYHHHRKPRRCRRRGAWSRRDGTRAIAPGACW